MVRSSRLGLKRCIINWVWFCALLICERWCYFATTSSWALLLLLSNFSPRTLSYIPVQFPRPRKIAWAIFIVKTPPLHRAVLACRSSLVDFLFRELDIRKGQFCTLCPYFWTLLGVEKSRIVIIFSRLRSGPKNLLLLLCRVRGTTDICVRYHTPRAASGINEFEVPYGESASLALPMTPASGRQCSGCL